MQLIERERELATLRGLLTGSLGGQGGVALISGAVASGKTALLRSLSADAEASGALLLRVTAVAAERRTPLSVAHALLRALPGHTGRPLAPARAGEPSPDTLRGFSAALLAGSARTPLVIGVDDTHHADPASLRCLLHLAHRLRSARILLVLTERGGGWPDDPLLHAELRSRPHCVRIGLGPLSRAGQTQLLTERLGAAKGLRLAAACHSLTGGNPLLVRALLADHRRLGPTVGPAFTQAWTECLHRGEPGLHEVAGALAVLPDAAPAGLVGRLLGRDTARVAHLVATMDAAGLLDAGRFRHPVLRTALLDAMPARGRAALHTRTARLLHDHGHAALSVAEHLIAASRAGTADPGQGAPWAVAVLQEAAGRAWAEGERQLALVCLGTAHGICPEGPERVRVVGALARARWRTDPVTVLPLLPELCGAAREGGLDGRGAAGLLGALLWFGRTREASRLLALPAPPPWHAATLLAACAYPELLPPPPPEQAPPPPPPRTTPTCPPLENEPRANPAGPPLQDGPRPIRARPAIEDGPRTTGPRTVRATVGDQPPNPRASNAGEAEYAQPLETAGPAQVPEAAGHARITAEAKAAQPTGEPGTHPPANPNTPAGPPLEDGPRPIPAGPPLENEPRANPARPPLENEPRANPARPPLENEPRANPARPPLEN
ncbi:AAA family ATPase, partial [Streptomyces sp. NPDC001985]|uniref:AAA family ATPase n=1 Tax=Streptomyces sp. NPDC001985 TaxID=3154406 RepID=UPI003321F2B2